MGKIEDTTNLLAEILASTFDRCTTGQCSEWASITDRGSSIVINRTCGSVLFLWKDAHGKQVSERLPEALRARGCTLVVTTMPHPKEGNIEKDADRLAQNLADTSSTRTSGQGAEWWTIHDRDYLVVGNRERGSAFFLWKSRGGERIAGKLPEALRARNCTLIVTSTKHPR
ncbi:hypothetical protein [Ktedonospora formicarum]|uniref:Uncharacterized protein n=1 Tax=Ktedonospora formicarum TaxID=2778364 RepID=A0A8J3I5Z2_9CHLR|nr:hypothetical protein [Ktedonospora formicarum]GHO49251.1 hypothetical protein KSX_74140 [Ktedonospora formicarum]